MAARSGSFHRRDFLRSIGSVTGLTAPPVAEQLAPEVAETTGVAAPAAAAAPFAPAPLGAGAPAPTVIGTADRHLLGRFSYGVSQRLVQEAAAGGGAAAWFETQLTPDGIADGTASGFTSWWPHLSMSPLEQAQLSENGSMSFSDQQLDFIRWTLLRRMYTKRQVQETLAEFWSNLLYIPAPLRKAFPHRVDFDAVIRRHSLGRFDEMLVAAVLHPSMLCYLDNAKSTRKALNENLGREVLELHTVGREAAFTEDDVAASARILTGYHVDENNTWAASYVQTDHFVGPVSVLGFSAANASTDGRGVAVDYLHYLARHPATAARIARRLAVRFVSDTPSAGLVSELARVFTASGTSIPATLRALVAHREFKAAVGKKVRTPTEDMVNTFRVLDITVLRPTDNPTDAAYTLGGISSATGQLPFEWPRPDGFPDSNESWSSASRALGSWRVHKGLSATDFPLTGATFVAPVDWLPALPVRFDALVNHLARTFLGRDADAALQLTASRAVDVQPGDEVVAGSQLVTSWVPDLLVALLDTPHHMMR